MLVNKKMSWIIRQNHWDICSTGQPAGESSSCERQEACLFQQHLQQRWEQLGRFPFSWAALSTGNHSHWVSNRKHGRELSGGLGVILTSFSFSAQNNNNNNNSDKNNNSNEVNINLCTQTCSLLLEVRRWQEGFCKRCQKYYGLISTRPINGAPRYTPLD